MALKPPPFHFLSIDVHDSDVANDRNSFHDLSRAGMIVECSTRLRRPHRVLYRSAIIINGALTPTRAAASSRARATSRACAAAAAVAAAAAPLAAVRCWLRESERREGGQRGARYARRDAVAAGRVGCAFGVGCACASGADWFVGRVRRRSERRGCYGRCEHALH